MASTSAPLVSRVHARVGLLGNPSDGYGGKTISFSLANYHAEVRPRPASTGALAAPIPSPHLAAWLPVGFLPGSATRTSSERATAF